MIDLNSKSMVFTTQVIDWDRGRPARNAPQVRSF
jgi:hypothetical protein